jgi:3-oxoacyl-[acyl-carrier protein] reductase
VTPSATTGKTLSKANFPKRPSCFRFSAKGNVLLSRAAVGPPVNWRPPANAAHPNKGATLCDNPAMELGIGGRRAAVAASSKGLGFAIAAALAAEGVRVALCGRDGGRVEAAALSIGKGAIPLVADVSTPDGARRFIVDARGALGGVDILVANAGGPPAGTFESTEVDAYPAALDLNLLSVVAMCKEAVPEMRERRWGRIVAVTSIAVRQPIGNLILSNTARAGTTGFLKTLSREIAAEGITVNSLQPGLFGTERLQELYGGDLEEAAAGIPAGQVGRPEDFGAIAAFLCSEHARHLTGAAIQVDGGSYAGLM